MGRPKAGETFEKLVTSIEAIVGDHDNRIVEYSKRLRHIATGRLPFWIHVLMPGR